jgi:hypothetical protein
MNDCYGFLVLPDSGVQVSGARVILVGISNFSRLDLFPCIDRVFSTAYDKNIKIKTWDSLPFNPPAYQFLVVEDYDNPLPTFRMSFFFKIQISPLFNFFLSVLYF